MRVLFLTPRFPWPPLKGDQLIFFHRLRHLGARHEITLISFVESDDELEGREHLEPYCERIETVTLPRLRSVANVGLHAPFSGLPLQVLYYRSRAYARLVAEATTRSPFDVVHAFFHRVAPYALATPAPKVLDLMDSMQLRMERNAALERPPKRWLFREELRRVRRYEPELVERFDHVIVVAERDREPLPPGPVSVVPNGVDADEFAPRPQLRRPRSLVFSGNMSYEPNVHAVTWFVERCWPRVRAAVPDASFTIAGSRPARAVRELEREPGVRVTGFVDSMPDALNTASLAVAPLRSGTGIQNKILEAMACGLPVVTTPLGLGSIAARNDEEVVVEDGEDEFADAVIRLLGDARAAAALGAKARDFVVRRHSWQHAADEVDAIYRAVTNARAGVAA